MEERVQAKTWCGRSYWKAHSARGRLLNQICNTKEVAALLHAEERTAFVFSVNVTLRSMVVHCGLIVAA